MNMQAGDRRIFARRLTICVITSWVLTVVSLTFADHDSGALLCVGIAAVSALALFVFGVTRKGQRRLATVLVTVVQIFAAWLLMSNYSLVRDHVRWRFLSGGYKAKVLAQPLSKGLQHVEWDSWGFAGIADTTVFLVFDSTGSLEGAAGAPAPVKAPGLPCAVVGVRRLSRQWYAVLFYSDTYWGQDACK